MRLINVKSIMVLLTSILLFASQVSGAEITVMTSGAFTAAHLALIPQVERVTNHKIVTAATGMGTGANFIPTRLQRGERADVVIVASDALDDMIKQGTIVAGSRVDLARSSIGLAVRTGAPKPDISSVDALKRTLLNAKSIAYSASVSGDYLSTELFQRLGIAEQVKSKSRKIERERVGAVVARGEAEIGFQQISELLPIAGIDYVGPLPPEVQRVTVFSAGLASSAREPAAARVLITFLVSPAADSAIRKSGMEPVTSR